MPSIGTWTIGLKVKTSVNTIAQRIQKAITDHLNQKFVGLSSSITNYAKRLIREEMETSEETQAIISGQLREELGIVDPSADIASIIDAISNTVTVNVGLARRHGGGITMRARLTAVPIDLISVIGHVGKYTTDKGVIIPWFEWLTNLGDKIIVRDYSTQVGHPQTSRTGDMIMVKTGKSGWRVPPEYSGTATNNFVTRATDLILPDLAQFIENEVKRVL